MTFLEPETIAETNRRNSLELWKQEIADIRRYRYVALNRMDETINKMFRDELMRRII